MPRDTREPVRSSALPKWSIWHRPYFNPTFLNVGSLLPPAFCLLNDTCRMFSLSTCELLADILHLATGSRQVQDMS
ncbi:hypothetical protein [Nostoc sp.]|uniref:hypothetical protein n=1 Tax=Nostoc sp. TaxID=1180 RepID=UPI002FF7FE98